jgi:hypothetical protein
LCIISIRLLFNNWIFIINVVGTVSDSWMVTRSDAEKNGNPGNLKNSEISHKRFKLIYL